MMISPFVSLEEFAWKLFLVIFLRYFILAAIAFSIWYLFKRKAWIYKKIQKQFPIRKDYIREFSYSVIASCIFTLVGIGVFKTDFRNFTQLYMDIGQFGITYFVLSIPVMLLIHDTYFYWAHRIMHHPLVFSRVHRTHHLSTNPSPWAAMAFHPVEAIIEAGIIPVLALVMPVHPLSLGIFLLIMMIYNVYGHIGYELFPRGFATSKIGRWVNTSVSHNQHHESFKGNYGFYFLWWDRWMKTIRQDYELRFKEISTLEK